MPDRITKINALLLQEISRFFHEEVPEVFVTVTRVQTSPDLKESVVWVSFLNNRGSNIEELRSKISSLRKVLGQRLRMKYIPRFNLRVDTGMEYAEEISELIQGINRKN